MLTFTYCSHRYYSLTYSIYAAARGKVKHTYLISRQMRMVLRSLAPPTLFFLSAPKIGSGLSSIQDLCLRMRNYTAARVNKHN